VAQIAPLRAFGRCHRAYAPHIVGYANKMEVADNMDLAVSGIARDIFFIDIPTRARYILHDVVKLCCLFDPLSSEILIPDLTVSQSSIERLGSA